MWAMSYGSSTIAFTKTFDLIPEMIICTGVCYSRLIIQSLAKEIHCKDYRYHINGLHKLKADRLHPQKDRRTDGLCQVLILPPVSGNTIKHS